MLPVALFGPCVFTVPMATHGSFQRAAAYCEVVVCSDYVEQLNQLQQSIITTYIPFTAPCAVSEMSRQTCKWSLTHLFPIVFWIYRLAHHCFSRDAEAVYCWVISGTCCMTVFCSLSYIKAQIFPQKKWLFHAFCLRVSSCCLSSLGPTHSSQDKEQSTTKLVLLQKAKKRHGNHKTTKQFSQAGVHDQQAESNESGITCLSFFCIVASPESAFVQFSLWWTFNISVLFCAPNRETDAV